MFVRCRSNWNLEVLVFEERGKLEYLEKTSQSKDENQQPTYDTGSRSRTRATVVRGECSHHCVIPACHPVEKESGEREPAGRQGNQRRRNQSRKNPQMRGNQEQY